MDFSHLQIRKEKTYMYDKANYNKKILIVKKEINEPMRRNIR